MKIAILSHFNRYAPEYALHVGWHERAKMMDMMGVDFDFLTNVNRHESFPHEKAILTKPDRHSKKTFEGRVKHYVRLYKSILKDYDVVLTADMIYQKGGDFLAHNAAMRKVSKKLKCKWFHWVHSGWVHPSTVEYPESLRFKSLDPKKHTIVTLNESECMGIARQYDMPIESVKFVHNPKDIRAFKGFSDMASYIVKYLELPTKDIVQILPFCTSRMQAKGIDATIEVFAGLKKRGHKVALIFANANAGKYEKEIDSKCAKMQLLGLTDDDFIFTSDKLGNKPLPREDVANLFSISNLFVYASWRETASNVLYEAKISDCLLVLSTSVPAFHEGGGKDAIYFESSWRTPGLEAGEENDLQKVDYNDPTKYFDDLAQQIEERVPSLDYLWEWSYEKIWYNEMKPLIYGGTK